jgi:HrpA-like RNA helicase
MMPCDISLTKLIVTGYTLGTLHEAIAIAAVLSTDRDLFINSYSQYKAIRDNARKTFKDIWIDFNENDLKQDDVFDCYKYRAKLDFDNENLSDHITSLRVF